MSLYVTVNCYFCGKRFLKDSGHFNKNVKLGHNFYCSRICLSKAQNKQVSLSCKNPLCLKTFKIQPNDVNSNGNNYCSLSCAAKVNNAKFPKRQAVIKKCLICGKDFTAREKYCSTMCQYKSQVVSENKIIESIKEIYNKKGRIPLKREFTHYHAARERFGTWNNAIKAAGFEPNPVMFAKKYIAADGHKCDSLAEKVIDDWLNFRKIKHKRCIPYPGNSSLTADFLVGDYWVEFFGLFGEHRRYDKLRLEKLKIAKELKLKFIEIYPKDLFPENKLGSVLAPILKSF